MKTIAELLDWGTLQLGTSNLAPFEAKVLLANILQCNAAFLFNHSGDPVSQEKIEAYRIFITRRQQQEPLPYIIGSKEFYFLTFEVSHDTLIPRTQTELLVKTALENLSGPKKILDLGTGCGAIGCTLAYLKPDWIITSSDISTKALQVAKRNADKLQLKNIEFIESNWFEAFGNRTFDAIISNPPYLRTNDVATFFGHALFEPKIALSFGPTGFEVFELILNECDQYLKPNGFLAFEHGFDQAEKLQFLLSTHFTQINTVYDSAGNARVTFGYKR